MSESLPLGALASNTVVQGDFAQQVDQEHWAISMDVTANIHGLTAGEGPILFGVAHEDYTAAEVEEWLEATASWDIGDKIAQEKAKRKCRIIGTFVSGQQFNDGKPKRVKLGWRIEDNSTLALWAYNESAATLTTGAIIEFKGPVYLKPI